MGLLLAIAALNAVPVSGNASCPRPETVTAALAELVPGEARAGVAATLDDSEQGVRLRLRDPSSRIVGERVLDADLTCDDRARAAAVLIVAWESEVPAPGFTGPSLSREPLAASAPAPAPPSTLGVELGAGVLGAWSASAAPGAQLYAALAFSPRFALVAGLDGTAPRQLALAPGSVDWERFSLGLGARYALWDGAARLELDGRALASLLLLRGVGFTQNGTASNVDPGGRLALRLAWPRGTWRAWVELSGAAWPLDQRADVNQVGSAPLPRFEAALSAGAAFASR